MRFLTTASARGLFLMIAVIWKYVLSDWVYALHQRYVAHQPKQSDADTEEMRRMREAFRQQWREAQRKRESAASDGSRRRKRSGTSERNQSTFERPPLTPRPQYLAELGMQKGASPAQIKKAYRKLVRAYHPDRFVAARHSDAERAEASAKMRKINEAYDWLEQNPL